MKVIRAFDIETDACRFDLEIGTEAGKSGFVGVYSGTTPKFAPAVRPGARVPMLHEVGSGKRADADIEKLIWACRAEIEKIDGRILRTTERKLKTED
jgi:hypothetical protein